MLKVYNFVSSKIKSLYGRLTSKEGSDSIRDTTVENIAFIVDEYSRWYDQRGLHLPPDFAADPASWSEALHKMKRAFRLLYDELNGEGEYWEAKHKWDDYGEVDKQLVEDLEKEIKEGIELFGSQLYYMTDNWHGVKSGH